MVTKVFGDAFFAAACESLGQDGAFVQEDGKNYIRHDAMQLFVNDDGRFVIAFFWKGKEIYRRIEDFFPQRGQALWLDGIEGRVSCSLF